MRWDASCNARRYADRMPQLVTRLSDDLVEAVDALVAAGVVASRSEAVRVGLERIVDRHRRDVIGEQIVSGYRTLPQLQDDHGWTDAATVAMIADEPW